MKSFRLQLLFIIITVICISFSCKTPVKSVQTLTEAEKNIIIEKGVQATTLALIETHTIVTTEVLTSHDAARRRAVQLGADIAQLIYTSTSNTESSNSAYGYNTSKVQTKIFTFRFWKQK